MGTFSQKRNSAYLPQQPCSSLTSSTPDIMENGEEDSNDGCKIIFYLYCSFLTSHRG